MHTFRRLSRRSWLLHLYLMLSMVFWPMPQIGAYWTRDASGNKVSLPDPTTGDSWFDEDSDNDSLFNGEEVFFGSDPFNPDSDYDGLTDRDERDLTPVMLGYTASTDPWNWDSDGDGYSDHDEYWSYINGLPLNVSYSGRTFPNPLPATYFKDLDGDGTDNLSDYSPEDPNVSSPPPPADSDGDSVADENDSHPNDSSLWNDWNGNGVNDDQETTTYDTDGDNHDDSSDSHPYDASLWEDWNGNGVNDSSETPPTDSDGDGYSDDQDSHITDNSRWDDWNNNGISDSSEPPDSDGDGVIDDEEYINGTNPWFHDSDGDGISDGEERTATTNPLQVDTDSDGLTDHEEIMIYGTNPLLARTNAGQTQLDYYHVNHADSDADGIPNVIESWYGRDPASNLDAQSDLDGDGFTDLEAYQAGWHFTVVFTIYDADRDGITDAREAYWGLSTTDPIDATEDHDNDGLLTIEELRLGLNPFSASTMGTPDLPYANQTWNLGWYPSVNRGSTATSLDNDTDGDGMPDYWEHKHRLDWRKASDAIRDADRDGLSNLTEFRFETHPRIPKTTNNTHDRSRLYATGSPVNASTAGGLLSRYRATIQEEFSSGPTLSKFFSLDVPPEPSPPNIPSSFKVKIKRSDATDWPSNWSQSSSAYVHGFAVQGGEIHIPSGFPCTCSAFTDTDLDDGQDSSNGICHKIDGDCGLPQGQCPCKWIDDFVYEVSPSSGVDVVRFQISAHFNSVNSPPKTFYVFKNDLLHHVVDLAPDPQELDRTIETLDYYASVPTAPEQPHQRADSTDVYSIEEHVKGDSPSAPPLSFSASDSAGGRYRKLSLSGVPIPDSKPQAQDESGEREEETYIDAYTRQLQHSVTDIYAADASTLLPLSVRRDSTPEIWNLRNGLRPNEKNDQPFGPGWRSNICSYVRFEYSSDNTVRTATVVDEQGASARFLGLIGGNWQHSREELTNAKTAASSLVGEPFAGATFVKKFGTICHYEAVGPDAMGQLGYEVDQDRLSGSDDMTTYVFARLKWVQDRYGNRLIYEYPDNISLVPKKIYDPDRTGRQVSLAVNSSGRVTQVKGPSGEVVNYQFAGLNGALSEVRRGQSPGLQTTVTYTYQHFTQRDDNFWLWGGRETPIEHQYLASITDELGRQFSFAYEHDLGMTYQTWSSDNIEERVQLGLPCRLTSVSSPAGTVTLSGYRHAHAGWPKHANWPSTGGFDETLVQADPAQTTVQGPSGSYVYKFTEPFVTVPSFTNLDMEQIANPLSINMTVTYTKMVIESHPNLDDANPESVPPPPLTETYVFLPSASLALGSATDVSGNTTQFTYDGSFDDPLTETSTLDDGTPVTKSFTYDAATRIMTSMTDPSGVKTEYTIDNSKTVTRGSTVLQVRGLKTAEKVVKNGSVLRETKFFYDNAVFPGLVTRQWALSSNEAVAPSSVVVTELGTAVDSLGQNPGWWCTFRTKAGPANGTGGLASTVSDTLEIQDLSGRKRTMVDARGQLTNFDYDALGRLSRVTHPDNAFKTLSYDAHGNLTAERQGHRLNGVDVTLAATFHLYDESNRRRKTAVDANGNNLPDWNSGQSYTTTTLPTTPASGSVTFNGDIVSSVEYDSAGRVDSEVSPRGIVTAYEYDAFGRRISTTVNPGGLMGSPELVTRFSDFTGGSLFDTSSFKPRWMQEPGGRTTTQEYDSLYRPVSTVLSFDAKITPPTPEAAEQAAGIALGNLLAAMDAMETAKAEFELAALYTQTPQQAHSNLQTAQENLDVEIFLLASKAAEFSDPDLASMAEENWAGALGAEYSELSNSATSASEAVTIKLAEIEGEQDPYLRAQMLTDLANLQTQKTDADAALSYFTTQQSLILGMMVSRDQYLAEKNLAQTVKSAVDAAALDPALKQQYLDQSAAKQGAYKKAERACYFAGLANFEAQYFLNIANSATENGGVMAIASATTLTEYDLAGRPVKVTDPLNRVTLNQYDDLGNLIKVTEPDITPNTADNPTVQSFYTHHGKPWKVIDQNGTETITTYDALGRAVSVQGPVLDAQGTRAVTMNEYDAAGNVIRVTDPLGRVTETLYDARNRPWKVYAPTVWDAEIGQYVRPTSETTYDALGQVIEVKDPTGAVTTTHYDRAGRKWCVQAPSPVSANPAAPRPTTITTFDPGGLPLTVTNPLGQTITNTYDAHGRLTQTVDAEGIVNQFAYDEAGNRTSVKDGKNQTTTFAYDGLNRLVSQTFANGDTWTHSYNAIQKLSQTSPRGIVTSYTYDARDRLLTVNAPAHTASGTPALRRDYNYDNAGRLLTVTEYTAASLISTPSSPVPDPATSVSYTYDAMGRVTAESSHGQTHFYEYDLAGNRVRAEYSTGRVVETSYDGLNRPEAIAEGPRLTRYGYDLAGRALLLVSPNGQTSMNSYDRLGRLVDRTLFKTPAMSDGDVLAEFSWSHDALGNVTAQYETWPGAAARISGVRVTTMGYDDNNRLTSEVVTQPEVNGATPTTTTLYTYDAANNRSTKTVSRTIAGEEPVSDEDTGHWTYTYNSANQLTAWAKRSAAGESIQKQATLTYDASGNRTGQTVTEATAPTVNTGHKPPAAQPGITTYAWDAQDRLRSVTVPAQPGIANSEPRTFTYGYDYRTRRISTGERTPSSVNETRTSIVFSGGLSVAEWETQSSSSFSSISGSPTVEYTRGPDMGGGVGGLLYTSRSESASASSSRTLRYNLSNGRGDIVAQADSSATLTWTASYEAYGKRTKETGENKDKQRGNSKDEDPTGLLNEGFRYRDIETGVWLSRDPAGFVDGPNVYAYVQQNPWTAWDPLGLEDEKKQTIQLQQTYDASTPWDKKLQFRSLVLSLQGANGSEPQRAVQHLQNFFDIGPGAKGNRGNTPDWNGPDHLIVPFEFLASAPLTKHTGNEVLMKFGTDKSDALDGKNVFEWARGQNLSPGDSIAVPDLNFHKHVPRVSMLDILRAAVDKSVKLDPNDVEQFYALGSFQLNGAGSGLRATMGQNGKLSLTGNVTFSAQDVYDWNANNMVPFSKVLMDPYIPKNMDVKFPPGDGFVLTDSFFKEFEVKGFGKPYDVSSKREQPVPLRLEETDKKK